MDQTEENSFQLVLKEWIRSSILFRDPTKWLEGLRMELAEIPRLEEEIKALRLRRDVSIQSLLLDTGFNSDEIFELMEMPATAINIIDGDLEKWRKARRKQRSQSSGPMIL